MRVKTWKVIDWGEVPETAAEHAYTCQCGHEAFLPMLGRPLAQLGGGGIVFDTDGPYALPTTIQCRRCRRILTNAPEPV